MLLIGTERDANFGVTKIKATWNCVSCLLYHIKSALHKCGWDGGRLRINWGDGNVWETAFKSCEQAFWNGINWGFKVISINRGVSESNKARTDSFAIINKEKHDFRRVIQRNAKLYISFIL